MSFSGGGQFGLQAADTTNGNTSQFINPGGGFGFGTEWQPWSFICPTQSDIAFRIEGMEVPNLQIEFDAIVNAPLNQIITNDAFLEYGSYISQATGHTFTGFGTYLPITIK
jgi:hypothetical protein